MPDILVRSSEGITARIRDTALAHLADVLETVAAQGEDAVMTWCEHGEDRPGVEDVTTCPWTGVVTLHLMDAAAALAGAAVWEGILPGRPT